MKYILVDLNNLFQRIKHVTAHAELRNSLCITIILQSILKIHNKFSCDHIVFFSDNKSWRYEIYPNYKLKRHISNNMKTEKEKLIDKEYYGVLNELIEFLDKKTNCSMLNHELLEADDLIAFFIDLHKEDSHIIISCDRDFIQLISPNVSLYDGMKEYYFTHNQAYDKKDEILKIKGIEVKIEPEWELFCKIFKGDPSDNILSAYPNYRKNKLKEAFDDRIKKGYSWNNLMLQTWTDHKGDTHKVKDKYELNRLLIDLTAQPPEIKIIGHNYIKDKVKKNRIQGVGFNFLKFCEKHELIKIAQYPEQFTKFLSLTYEK